MTPIQNDLALLLAGQKSRVYVSTNPLPEALVETELKAASEAGLFVLHFVSGNSFDLLRAVCRLLGIQDPESFLVAVAASAPLAAGLPDFARLGGNVYGLAWATAYYLCRSRVRGIIVFDPDRDYAGIDLVLGVLQILHRESDSQVCVVLGPVAQKRAESFPDLEVTRHPAPFGSPAPAPADEPATAPPAG